MPTDSDYVIFFAVLLAVLGAGLLRGGYSSLSALRSVLQQC